MSPGNDRRLWWFLLAFFATWTLRATVLYQYDARVPPGLPRMSYQAAIKFALWVVPACAYLWFSGERPLGRSLKLTTPLTRRAVFWTIAGVAIVTADVVGSRLLIGANPAPAAPSQWLRIAVAGGATVLFEEIFFRGFVLQQLAVRLRFWPANLATSALFMLAHVPNWLWTRGATTAVASDLAAVFLLSCLFGYVVRRGDSLWPAVATHFTNNFLLAVL